MNKTGAIQVGYTPQRSGDEKTTQELEDSIEKQASERAQSKMSDRFCGQHPQCGCVDKCQFRS